MAEKNRTKVDYPADAVTIVKAGLLYVAVKLGDLLDEVVVVGGVVPSLLIDQDTATHAHVGTTDLDLALSLSVLEAERYRDISGRLRDAGFKPALNKDGKTIRQTWLMDGKLDRITVDFLIPRSDKADPKRLLQDLEKDFGAIRARALELAFADRQTIPLEGLTIEGDRTHRSVQVAGAASMIVLKSFAFDNRGAEKDAYDLYYLLHESGIETVGDRLNQLALDPSYALDITDARKILVRDFSEPDHVGIGSVLRFLGDESNEDLRADVTGTLGALIRRLNLPT